MIAGQFDLAAKMGKAVHQIMSRRLISTEMGDVHATDVGERLHVSDLHHDRLSMVRADGYTSLKITFGRACPRNLPSDCRSCFPTNCSLSFASSSGVSKTTIACACSMILVTASLT